MLVLEIKEVIKKCDIHKLRKFGLTVGPVVIVIGSVLFFKHMTSAPIFIFSGLLLILLAFLKSLILKPIYIVWMSIATVLGFIMTRVILSVLFILVFSPVGIILRLIRKDLLHESIDPETISYWIARENKSYDPKSLEKQY